MIGTVFLDRYRVESALGQGGMGIVYRAHDLLLDRDVALKVLSISALGTEGRARMLNEAQAAARLNHPNIVSVYDAGEKGNVPFIVMEFVEGKSLHEAPPAQTPQILAIARQICLALEHAHARSVVHRDLKPENVLLTPNGLVKLTDFGLARSMASRLTSDGSIVGSVLYLAPELALGQAYDARADLYALGVMLYEFAVGELPFTASDPIAVISQHLYAPVVPPRARKETIPPALEALVLRLMSKLAEDRPATAREVREQLEQIAAGQAAAPAKPFAAVEPSLLDRVVRGRLVGREREMAEANQVWARAKAGESGVLLVSGEPGIGKTRLSSEIVAQAQVQGAFALLGNCYAEGGSPFAPLAQVIEGASRLYGLERLAGLPEILALAPGLRARFPDVSPGTQLELQAEQLRLFESLVELVTALSNQAPVLILLEDAHWADSGSLSLLRHLARRAGKLRLRLLILMTYREVELDDAGALYQVLYDLHRERLAVRIKLTRLDREGTGKLLAALLDEETTPELLDGIYQETEGNPFFIEEVCKALIEQGELSLECGRWCCPRMDDIEIPQSIKMAIQARIQKLPPAGQETLRVASVLGREFDFETLKGVSELDEETLIEALESATRAQLLVEVRRLGKQTPSAGMAFSFAHALTVSTLHESMSGLRRQRLHQRAALALESRYSGRTGECAQQLGRHFSEAGDWEKAAHYLLQAGDQARKLYTYPEAIDFYQDALGILKDRQDYAQAASTLMKIGLLQHATFNFQLSRQAYQEGFTLWKKAGESLPASMPPAPHALRLRWRDPITLDSTLASDGTSIAMIDQLFAGLVSLTPDMDVSPEIAHSWEILENGRRYIFHLREDVAWTDGTPVTAGDFEFAWKRVLDPQTGSRNPVLFYDIRGARDFHQGRISDPNEIGVRAVDATTLEVELEQPTGYFLHLLTYAATYPVPQHAVQASGSAWTEVGKLINNGPFCLEDWKPGDCLILSRNPRYSGRFRGNVQRVEFTLRPEDTNLSRRLAAYEAGQLDVCGLRGPSSESNRARQRHAGEYVSLPTAIVTFLIFDTFRSPFDDVRVRQAFTHALDRETLAEVYLYGNPIPATAGVVPPGLPGHLEDAGLPYSPERARQLLAEAGYPNGRGFPRLKGLLITTANTEFVEYIRDQWREHLGVECFWESMDECDYYRNREEARPHISINGWVADYPDPDSFLRVGISYQARWKHPAYFELVENARRVTRHAERMEMYREAERILIQEAPVVPICYGRDHLLIKPWIRRYSLSPIKPLILNDVLIEAHGA